MFFSVNKHVIGSLSLHPSQKSHKFLGCCFNSRKTLRKLVKVFNHNILDLDSIFTKSPNPLTISSANQTKSQVYHPKQNLSQTQASFQNQYYANSSQVHPNTSNVPTVSKDLRQIRFRGSHTSGISEEHILKEITFRLQNIKSELIIVDGEGYSALRPTIDVSDTVRRIVRQLSEMGWLYGKIIDEREDGGAVKKALKLAVRE